MISWLWQFVFQPLGLGGVKGKAIASYVGAAPTPSASTGAHPRYAAALSAAAAEAGTTSTFP
jgi:hypothetical protein